MYQLLITVGDLEIKLLKARLEQTKKDLERIVAQMGSVAKRIANNGNIQHGKTCCTAHEENSKEEEVKDLIKNGKE